ncbi:MAG: methyltransferase [Cyclobacteriaceae bacterium]
MPNTYFDFKEFRIDQGQSGMKVTTEGCILGAWAKAEQPKRILDIGTGTGLLSLMLVQKYPEASIDAIELESHAAAEATANFERSSWSHNLCLYESSIQKFAGASLLTYDLIACNPPFFSNSQRSVNSKKAQATHSDALPPKDLVDSISKLLSPQGAAFVLYPLAESRKFENELSTTSLAVDEELLIYDRQEKSVFRRILKLTRSSKSAPTTKNLIIKENDGAYTAQFVGLLKPYYLHL